MTFRDRPFKFSLAMLAILAINSLCCSKTALTMPKEKGNLTLDIIGLRNQEGVVCIALFDNPEGFPSDVSKAIYNDCFEIETLPLQISLKQVEYANNYAVSVLHDENEDSQLNTGFFGIPKEGVGFSQNPPIQRRMPFDKTSFEFELDSTPIEIKMKYF